jgi:hypothetical protein
MPTRPPNERVAFRMAIISAYGAVLERQGPLRSTAELPFPKAIIRAALEDELKRGDPANERLHEAVKIGLMGLDDFVDPESLPPQLSPPQKEGPWEWGFPTNIVGVVIGAGILAGLLGGTIDDIAQGRLSRFPGWGPTVMGATMLLLIGTPTIMTAAIAVRQIRDTARLSRILRQRGVSIPFWRLLLQRGFEDTALELCYWLWRGERRA